MKICYVATIPAVVHAFLREHIRKAAEQHEVTVICNPVDKHLLDGLHARVIFMPIERKPSLWLDLKSLMSLVKLFRNGRYDIVHSIMPKTGMLAMVAARVSGVPIRIHTYTGQVWATAQGLRRTVLKRFDHIIAGFCSYALTDSHSQRHFLIAQGVIRASKLGVLGEGSICGVDATRFRPDDKARRSVRAELNIPAEAVLLLFVGRLSKEKGMLELAHAFAGAADTIANIQLLLVGTEEDVKFDQVCRINAARAGQLHHLDFTTQPERYMAAADIFCLPSYREGFGMTIIEAAACGVPAVASRIYGITDAVLENETGILCKVADVHALQSAILTLAKDSALRKCMGEAARSRAQQRFSGTAITAELLQLYEKLSHGSMDAA